MDRYPIAQYSRALAMEYPRSHHVGYPTIYRMRMWRCGGSTWMGCGDWIHGYDKGMEIMRKRLYDIKAFPTLYLLDSDKNVILGYLRRGHRIVLSVSD